MSDFILQYSVLRYSPSLIAGESINLGIIFFSQDTADLKFCATKKLARVREFDDEVDVDNLKCFLKSLEDDLNLNLDNYNSEFDLKRYIKYYTNEYHFSQPIECSYNDFEKDTVEISKLYLPYDFEKSQRASQLDQVRFIATVLKSSKLSYVRKAKETGLFNERITYDFRFQEFAVKLFILKEKDLSKIFNDIKAWAWNCKYQPKGIKTVIIYCCHPNDRSEKLTSILSILHSATDQVYSWEDGIDWLTKIANRKYSK